MSYDVTRTLFVLGLTGALISFVVTVNTLKMALANPTLSTVGVSIFGAAAVGGFLAFAKIVADARREDSDQDTEESSQDPGQ